MFRKTITHYVCLLGALTFLFTSCQEDTEIETSASVPSAVEQPDIAVKNGMLHFKDQSVWESTIKAMQDTEDYGEYVAALGFENSLRAKYDAIEESDELLEDYFEAGKLPEIMDDLFASLLNEHAMVKIDQTLYKITDEYTFSAVDRDGSMTEYFEENSSLQKLSDVTTFENVDGLADKTMVVSGNDMTQINARFQGDRWHIQQYGNYRVKVGAWSRTYGLYTSIGVKINTEEYKRGRTFLTRRLRWRNEDANYLYCGGYARTQVCESSVPCTPVYDTSNSWNTRRNKHRAEKTFLDHGGIGIWYVTRFVAGEYKFEFENGAYHTLDITFE